MHSNTSFRVVGAGRSVSSFLRISVPAVAVFLLSTASISLAEERLPATVLPPVGFEQVNTPLPDAVPGEFITKFNETRLRELSDGIRTGTLTLIPGIGRRGSRMGVKRTLLRRLGLTNVSEITHSTAYFCEASNSARNSNQVLSSLSRLSTYIRYVEPNYILQKSVVTANDPMLQDLWGLSDRLTTSTRAMDAWQILRPVEEVVVGVTDTGVEYTHEDLVGQMWENSKEIPDNGIDDDGNGYVDDVYGIGTSSGIHAITNERLKKGDPKDDPYFGGHGTHVAGTIAAKGNNRKGVIGIGGPNSPIKIMALKMLDESGNLTVKGAEEVFAYAVKMKQLGVNLKVLNASWGGYSYSRTMDEAIERLEQNDILLVAAAGNDNNNNDSQYMYPASYDYDNVISVAATGRDGGLGRVLVTNRQGQPEWLTFSNYGLKTVDIAAPGVDIASTFLESMYAPYMTYDGTSMASPHVAGSAALLLSENPDLPISRVKEILMSTATRQPSLAGKVASAGIVNLRAALEEARKDESNRSTPLIGIVTMHGEPVEGVTVRAGEFGQVETNQNGEFTIRGIPEGAHYSLYVSKTGYAISPMILEGTHDDDTVLTFTSHLRRYNIDGVIRAIDGSPLSGVSVNAGAVGRAVTDSNGHYEITGIQYGTRVNVTVQKIGVEFDTSSQLVRVVESRTVNFTGVPIANRPPTIRITVPGQTVSSSGMLNWPVGSTLRIVATVLDEDQESASFIFPGVVVQSGPVAHALPAGAVFSAASGPFPPGTRVNEGTVVWTPTAAQRGQVFSIYFQVRDQRGLMVSRELLVRVQ